MAQTTAPIVPQVYSSLDNVSASVGGGSRPQPPSPSPPSGVANGGSVWKNIPAPSIRSSTYFASGASGASVSRDVPVSSRSRDEPSSDFRRDAFAAVAVPSSHLHSPSSREGGVFSSLSPPPLTPPPPSFQQQAGSDRQQGAVHPAATALDIPSPVIASYDTLSGPVTALKSVDPPIPAIVVPIVMGNNNPVASAAAGHFKINLDAPFSVDSSMSASASMKNLDEVAEGTAEEEEDDATLDPLTASTVGRSAAPALAGFPAAATARASRSRNSSKSATTTPESATAAKSARVSRRRVRKASGASGAADEALRAENVNGLSLSGPPVSSLSFGASVTSAGGAIMAGTSSTPTASSATPPRSAEQILEQRGLSTLLQEFVTACAQEMPMDVLAFMAEWSVRRLTSQRVGPSRGAASSSGGAATPRGGSGTVFPASTIPTNTTTVSSARRPSGGGRSTSATPSATAGTAMDLSAPRLNASVLAAGAASASPSTSAVMAADGHTLTPQERQQQQVMRPPTDTSPLSVASPPRHHQRHRRHSTGTTAPQQHQSPQPPSSSPAAAWQGGSHPRSQRYGHAGGGGGRPSEVDVSSQHRSASNAGVAGTTTTSQHSQPPLVSLVASSGNNNTQPQPSQHTMPQRTLPTPPQQQASSPAALGGWSVPGRPPLSAPRAESVASSSTGLITLHQVSSGVGLVTLAPHAPPMAGNVFAFPRPGTASSATHSASRVRAVLAVVLAASDSNKEELLSSLDVVTTAAGAHFTFNQSTGSFLSPSAAASPRTLPVGAANVANGPTESSAVVGPGISGAVSPNRLSRQNTGTALADGTPPTANNDSFGATVRTLMTNGALGGTQTGGMTPGLRAHYESARAKLKDVENLALMPFESTRHAGAAVLFADLPGTTIDDDFVRLTSAADVAVLVVSVRTALKDMSQRRHGELYNRSLLAFSLGVKRVCLVLTDLRASASSAAVAMPQSQPPPPPPPTNGPQHGWANRSTSSIVTGAGNQSSGQWHLVDAVESEARLMLSRCGFEGNAVQCVRGASDLDAIVSAIHRLPPLARVRYVPEQCARLTATLMVLYGQGISPGDELVLHCLGPFRARVEALPSLLDRHTRAVTESNVAALRLNQVAAVRLVVTHVPTAAHGRGTPLARTATSATGNNNNNVPTTTVAISAPIVVYGGGRVLAMGHVTDLETLDEEDGDDGDDFAITSGR